MLIRPTEAVVSFAYNDSTTYGTVIPYNKSDNPAYELVWRAVQQLQFGTDESPLADFINESDIVLIKPNIVDNASGSYTNPAVVRPLIDMAIKAGAKTIWVGDSTKGYVITETVLEKTKYNGMIATLQTYYPNVTLKVVNLNNHDHWHWVYLGENSSFAGSGYTDANLDNSVEGSPDYYNKTDPQGINPDGHVMGWHAINDWTLNATVIINVPKLKTHNFINTASIKNHVGTSMAHPTNYNYTRYVRVVHSIVGEKDINYTFLNDGFWRDILDVNKIVLYTDKDGRMHSSQQRKYLNVVDAIQGKRGWGSVNPSWKMCHLEGPMVNTSSIIVSVDPVAADAVASRVMGYDFNAIRQINRTDREQIHPIGTHNQSAIRIIGDDIDNRQSYIYDHCYNWYMDAAQQKLNISDFTPPTINSINVKNNETHATINATVSDALTAYLYYGDNVVRMENDGDYFYAVAPKQDLDFYIIAQDFWFNTEHSGEYPLLVQEICSDEVDNDFDGYIDKEDQDCPFSYTMNEGWNLVGYTFPTQNITTALSSINGCYQTVFSWYDFWTSFNPLMLFSQNTLKNMTFGRGYWVKVNCTEANWTR